ncbi:MAG: VanZ family protein [bacterium]
MKKLIIVLNWLLVILWMAVIFYFSSLPDLKSELPNFWDLVFRKLAHMTEYFVLTYFLIKTLLGHRIKKKTALLAALLLAFSYAISDEYHQTFTLGRSGRFDDVLIDSVGILLMTIMYQRIK